MSGVVASTDPPSAGGPEVASEVGRLAQAVGRGDREAEAQLVERFRRGLGYLLRRLVGDPAAAEDLVQETFRVALEALRRGEVRDTERLAGYLRGVARNLAFEDRRRAARGGPRQSLDTAAEVADRRPDPLSRTLALEDRLAVRRVLGELRSDRDRQILHRHYLEGDDRERVCRDLGLEPSTYYVVLHRARRRFRELLEHGSIARSKEMS
ncbi:MAG: sigma-70 family RNA polymerase sigma factor [Acidobacteriota bacterium]